jgi:hypothetical protein
MNLKQRRDTGAVSRTERRGTWNSNVELVQYHRQRGKSGLETTIRQDVSLVIAISKREKETGQLLF